MRKAERGKHGQRQTGGGLEWTTNIAAGRNGQALLQKCNPYLGRRERETILRCDELEGGKERLQKLHRSGENPTTGSAVRSTEREEGSGI